MTTPSEIARQIRQLSPAERAEVAKAIDGQAGGDTSLSYREAAKQSAAERPSTCRRVEYESEYLDRVCIDGSPRYNTPED